VNQITLSKDFVLIELKHDAFAAGSLKTNLSPHKHLCEQWVS